MSGSQDGATPLFKASHKGHCSVIEELLKYKPSLGLLPVSNTSDTHESLRSWPEEPSELASTSLMLRAHVPQSGQSVSGLNFESRSAKTLLF